MGTIKSEIVIGIASALGTATIIWLTSQTAGLLGVFFKETFIPVLPGNSVIAFDGACPKGWSNIGRDERERFAGRTLIVAGPDVIRSNNQTTVARELDDQGGEERVELRPEEMPRHQHEEYGSKRLDVATGGEIHVQDADNKGFESIFTDFAGEGAPHNNMPPYIALNFCKKVQSEVDRS